MLERLPAVLSALALLLPVAAVPGHEHGSRIPGTAPIPPVVSYVLAVRPDDPSGFTVEILLRNLPDTFRLAMAAHPEYDDRYWRHVVDLRAETPQGPASIAREDSAVWRVITRGGDATIRYRIQLPPPPRPPRAAWRPHLTDTGALVGGPHSFMYVVGEEQTPAHVRLDLPVGWDIATGLDRTADARTYYAANVETLMDSPVLVGRFRSWNFQVDGVPHRVAYWPSPGAVPFDSAALVGDLQGLVHQAAALFGRLPYREYTFMFEDDAYGGLEHANSVTLGVQSTDLVRDPRSHLPETAHEFVHTWNLMRIRPAEYRGVDYRTQPPTPGLWFSEGLTMFYADLLLRRAGLPARDSTRIAHLERLIGRYLASPGNWRISAEAVSRVAYNAEPGSLGDLSASTHLQGEVIGTMLDLAIRGATDGDRSMDDVMRLLMERFSGPGKPGFVGRDIERAVRNVCECDVSPLFDQHVRRGGRPIDFDRYLGLIGLRTRVSWEPAVWNGEPERDLRIFAWEPPDRGRGLTLIVTDPESIWGRAGFHTGDQVTSVNGSPVSTWPEFRAILTSLAMGDRIDIEVQRATGPFNAAVTVTGFSRPTVRLDTIPRPSRRQVALKAAWLAGSP